MVRVSDKNNIPRFLSALEDLAKHELQVGIFGENNTEILMIASVHEFGAPSINVPERSFIRAGFDQNENTITDTMERLVADVIEGRINARAAYESLGAQVASILQVYLTDLQEPPLKEATIKQKGSSNPLIDTGRMRQAITYRVVSV